MLLWLFFTCTLCNVYPHNGVARTEHSNDAIVTLVSIHGKNIMTDCILDYANVFLALDSFQSFQNSKPRHYHSLNLYINSSTGKLLPGSQRKI